jgi:hypothetical protein
VARPLLGLISGFIAGLGATRAGLAEPAGFLNPAAGARVEAGRTIGVEWATGSLSTLEFDESELVLSLDGGASFPLRVTRRIAPEIHGLTWQVPALPTRRARLALRTGSGAWAESETVGVVSDEFSIEVTSASPLEEVFFTAGEWRTRDALERPEGCPTDPGMLGGSQEERVIPAPARPVVAESRPKPAFERPGSPLVPVSVRPQTPPEIFVALERAPRRAPPPRRE